MKKINEWLKELTDIECSKLKPFEKHIASTCLSEHEINAYAILHASFIMFDGIISTEQEHLFKFYHSSLSSNLRLPEVINQSQNFNNEDLAPSIKLLEDNNLQYHFLLDVLIFSYLNGDVSDELSSILTAYCQSQSMSKESVNEIIYLCRCIFEKNDKSKPKLTDVFYTATENQTWSEFYLNYVNKNNVFKLDGGVWCIDKDIDLLEGNLKWNDSIVLYKNGAKLNLGGGSFHINNSELLTPINNFGEVGININNAVVNGKYEEKQRNTVFMINGKEQPVVVKNSSFSTINARAFLFMVNNYKSRFDNVTFEFCGNNLLLGGAVKFSSAVKFINCKFNRCTAEVAGALFFERGRDDNIVNCEFIKNTSALSNKIYTCPCGNYDCDHEVDENLSNAGSIFIKNANNDKVFINSHIDNNITIYKFEKNRNFGGFSVFGGRENGPDYLFTDSVLKGKINLLQFSSNYDDRNLGFCNESLKKLGITDYKNQFCTSYELEYPNPDDHQHYNAKLGYNVFSEPY